MNRIVLFFSIRSVRGSRVRLHFRGFGELRACPRKSPWAPADAQRSIRVRRTCLPGYTSQRYSFREYVSLLYAGRENNLFYESCTLLFRDHILPPDIYFYTYILMYVSIYPLSHYCVATSSAMASGACPAIVSCIVRTALNVALFRCAYIHIYTRKIIFIVRFAEYEVERVLNEKKKKKNYVD